MNDLVYRIIGKISHTLYLLISKFCKSIGVVYMLHDISDNEGEFSITPTQLEHFLFCIKEKNVIHLPNWSHETNFIAITIDDVPEGFYTYGYPLFMKYDIPFTIFVNTELLDTERYISTSQLKEMSASSLCTVGSHGTKHTFYKDFDFHDRTHFLRDSKLQLENICNQKIDLFAFPYGSFYACGYKAKKMVADYYKYGFGTVQIPITNPLLLPKYFIPRINITSKLLMKSL